MLTVSRPKLSSSKSCFLKTKHKHILYGDESLYGLAVLNAPRRTDVSRHKSMLFETVFPWCLVFTEDPYLRYRDCPTLEPLPIQKPLLDSTKDFGRWLTKIDQISGWSAYSGQISFYSLLRRHHTSSTDTDWGWFWNVLVNGVNSVSEKL